MTYTHKYRNARIDIQGAEFQCHFTVFVSQRAGCKWRINYMEIMDAVHSAGINYVGVEIYWQSVFRVAVVILTRGQVCFYKFLHNPYYYTYRLPV